jgi:hypothetical protein
MKLKPMLTAAIALLAIQSLHQDPAQAVVQSQAFTATPYISDKDNDALGEVSASYLNYSSRTPLRLLFPGVETDPFALQAGVRFAGVANQPWKLFQFDASGPSNSTNGPFFVIVYSDQHGVSVKRVFSLSQGQTHATTNGFTTYTFDPKSFGIPAGLPIVSAGIYATVPNEGNVFGPTYVDNFVLNGIVNHPATKILTTQDLSPTFPF